MVAGAGTHYGSYNCEIDCLEKRSVRKWGVFYLKKHIETEFELPFAGEPG